MHTTQTNDTETSRAVLALTPQFIAQSYRMPSHVQRALEKFYKEFPKDTKAPTWHVEPISTFRDPNLRTARANQQYRIVLRVPFDGDNTWYLLWIDNHDEAMAWAENKQVDWNQDVQAVQVYDVAETEAKVAEQGPVVEDDPFPDHPLAEVSDEQLKRIGVPEVLIPSIRTLNDFYEVDGIKPFIPDGVYENLLHVFSGDPIEYIIRDVEEGLVASDDFQAQKQSANNRRAILELSGDDDLDEALLGDFAAWRVFLHPTQRILAEGHFNGPVKVTGGAGTGKTVAALHRAKYLSHQGDGLILFTTFTKSLTESLERDLRSLGADMSKIRVTNLDKLVNQLAREYGILSGRVGILEYTDKQDVAEGILENLLFQAGLFDQMSGKDILDEYTEIVLGYDCQSLSDYQQVQRTGRGFRLGSKQREAIWKVLQQYEEKLSEMGYQHLGRLYNNVSSYLDTHPEKRPFRHVVADEIQDLGLIKLRLLRALAPHDDNDLFLVGDPLQKIYSGITNFSKVRIHIRGKRSRKLKINYRTTEQIRRQALRPILDLDFEDFDGEQARKDGYISLRQGAKPTYDLFGEQDKELEAIFERIKSYTDPEATDTVAPSEIAIGCLRTRNVNELAKIIHATDIPYRKVRGSRSEGDQNGVVLSTLHNLKGHEYKIVFLTGISAETFPSRPNGYQEWSADRLAEFDRAQAALLYVACSRAIWRLHVSGVGEECGMVGV